MIYVKSFLAGLVVLVLATLIVVGVAVTAIEIMTRRLSSQGGIAALEVNGPWISISLIALVAIPIFAAGFYWNLRRIRRLRG